MTWGFVEVSRKPRSNGFPYMAHRIISTTKFKNVYWPLKASGYFGYNEFNNKKIAFCPQSVFMSSL